MNLAVSFSVCICCAFMIYSILVEDLYLIEYSVPFALWILFYSLYIATTIHVAHSTSEEVHFK